jgi:DNA-binding transcriptional ArsR family regulator
MDNKREFFRLHSELCKALSHPKRQEILVTLREEELTVSELVEKSRIPQPNLSQHLALLKSRGVVLVRRKGHKSYYRLSDKRILQAYDLISEILLESLSSQNTVVKKAIGKRT